MHRLCLLAALAPSLLGCPAPESSAKVADLERRVDELSEVVSAIKGKPVGAREGEGEEEGEGEAEPADAGAPDAKPARPPPDARPAPDAPLAKAGAAAKDEAVPPGKDADVLAKVAATVAARRGPARWDYAGENGPAHWAELDPAWAGCATGQEQSPIDIIPQKGRASEVLFVYGPSRAKLVDTGQGLEVSFAAGNAIFIDGHRYDLQKLEVRSPSEHTIAGDSYPLELQLVHQDKEGKLAMVAVLYDVGAASPALAALWRKWPGGKRQAKDLPKPVDPAALLPENRAVYRYQGSQTTPPCSEGVVWNVMRRTKTDSPEHLELVKKHYPANARPVMPSEGRVIE